MSEDRRADAVVIGAGQAGLSAAHHLRRRGFGSALETPPPAGPPAARTFVVLDANPGPGGAWQHRWPSLTVASLNGIFDLPGMPKPEMAPTTPSREAIPSYFADFERAERLPVLRPVRVRRVASAGPEPDALLRVETDAGAWRAPVVINATGTWNHPLRPVLPGSETFLGRQLHTRDYTRLEDFAGQRVGVVGAGISAVQHLEELSRVAETAWYTRRPPEWRADNFDVEAGRDTIARVTADAEAGLPARSVVSYTGLPWSASARAARDRGALERRPMFARIEPHGVREADGSFTSLDAILWATGFRADIAHLAPLGLVNARGGVRLRGTGVAGEPRVHLIGFGPSQSTVGANRAGQAAVAGVVRYLDGRAEARR